jgi:hypothetical protein
MQTALTERKSQVFEDYLTAVQKRMEQDGKIKVYKDVLAGMMEAEEPEAAPQRRPPIQLPRR